MIIEISLKEKDKTTRVIEVPLGNFVKGVTKYSVLGFIGREMNRIRPPKRNAGVILNWMGAFAITDALMNLAFPKKEETKSDVKCEPYSDVMEDDVIDISKE